MEGNQIEAISHSLPARPSGLDVFTTWNTKMALDFLRNVKDKTEDHGTTAEDPIKGVQDAYDKFLTFDVKLSFPLYNAIPQSHKAYTDGASQSIQDFDSAPCIYMFSVHAVLAGNATSEMELIEVGYHGAGQSIRDFDSAIAYIFSVQAVLAGDATSEGHFDPSLHRSSGHRGSEPFSHRRDS